MRVFIDTPDAAFEAKVLPNLDGTEADLDGTFRAECLETGDVLKVNGWCCHIEVLE